MMVHVCVHTHMHEHTHTHTHMYMCTHTHSHTHSRTHCAAAAFMSEKLDGSHDSQMIVLNDSGVLVADQDGVWWQLQADGGGGVVFVHAHKSTLVGSSPLRSSPAGGA